MDPKKAYLLGYWLGDGSCSSNPSKNRPDGVVCVLHGTEADWPSVKKRLEAFNLGDLRRAGGHGTWRMGMRQEFVAFLRGEGLSLPCNSYTKVAPDGFLNYSEEGRLNLLAGLFDSDGGVGIGQRRGYVRFSSRSSRLNEQYAALATSLGFLVSTMKSKSGQKQTDEYLTYLRKKSYASFASRVPIQNAKAEKLTALLKELE